MECIWTDKSYYNKGFLFLGLNDRARYRRFIEGSKIKANHCIWHWNFLLLYCIYTYNVYMYTYNNFSAPREANIQVWRRNFDAINTIIIFFKISQDSFRILTKNLSSMIMWNDIWVERDTGWCIYQM